MGSFVFECTGQGGEYDITGWKYQFTLSDSGGQLHYSLTWNGNRQ